jgi:serine/threonine protein kinase
VSGPADRAAAPLTEEHRVRLDGDRSFVDRQIGSYQILSLLGRDGMGEVCRARDTKLGRDVAVKVLPVAFLSDNGGCQVAPDGSTLYYAKILTQATGAWDFEIRRARSESGPSEVIGRVAGTRVPATR